LARHRFLSIRDDFADLADAFRSDDFTRMNSWFDNREIRGVLALSIRPPVREWAHAPIRAQDVVGGLQRRVTHNPRNGEHSSREFKNRLRLSAGTAFALAVAANAFGHSARAGEFAAANGR
jgi:hypothetical protein